MTNPLNKIPLDKWQHFAVGAASALVLFVVFSLFTSILGVVLLGVGKKALDYSLDKKIGKQPDVPEMIWDVVATFLGGIVVWAAVIFHLHAA